MNTKMSQDIKNVLLSTRDDAQESKQNEVTKMPSHSSVNYEDFFGDALNDDNINEIITNNIPKLIVLAGFAGYGKSTLIGSLYHYLLLGGDIGGYAFMDSSTFTGFERRVSLRRLTEERLESNTKRTLRGDNYYLSLKLANKQKQHDIIISDKAGESYKEYKDDKDKAHADPALKRADNIIILIDLEELSKRTSATNSAILDLIENIPFNDSTSIIVAFTKIDLVDKDKLMPICNKLVDNISSSSNRAVKSYFINSKETPISNPSEIGGTIIEIFKDIIESYSQLDKNNDNLNWIKSPWK